MFAYVCIILTHLRDRQKSATTQRSLGETGEVNGSSQICRIPAAARRCHVPSNYGQKSKQTHPHTSTNKSRVNENRGTGRCKSKIKSDHIWPYLLQVLTFGHLEKFVFTGTQPWQVLLDLLWHRCLIGGKQCPILASKIVQPDQSFDVWIWCKIDIDWHSTN